MSTPVPTFDLELSPMARQTGVAYVHDVAVDVSQGLAEGTRVVVRDEGGEVWDAVVAVREEVRFGNRYRLRLLGPGSV